MEKIIEVLEEYKIIINLIPGYLFLWLLRNYVCVDITFTGVFEEFIMAYVIGTCVGRIASIVCSKLLRKCSIIRFTNYKDYVKACKTDGHIKKLLINANFYRNLFTTLILALIYKLIMKFGFNVEILQDVMLILMILILILSFKKEEDNITGRIELEIKK